MGNSLMETKQTVYGVAIVVLIAGFNVLAEQTSRSIVTQFSAPFFMMYFSTAWLVVLAPVHALGSIAVNVVNGASWKLDLVPDLKPLGLTGGWNSIYVAGLAFIPNSVASAVMSLDPAIVFGFSLVCLANLKLGWRKNIQQAFSSAVAIVGVCCILAGGNQDESDGEDDNFNYALGIGLAAIAALLSGSYKILYKFYFKNLDFGQCCYSLALIGILDILLMWPIALILIMTGQEDVSGVNEVWDLLCVSAFLGLCFNLLLNFGVAFTYPLFISVGAVLIVPANVMVDILYRGESFTVLQIVGTVLAVLALVILLLPLGSNETKNEHNETEKNDDEKAITSKDDDDCTVF